jgi:uncharacterized protein YjbI with pentapeptide repeats
MTLEEKLKVYQEKIKQKPLTSAIITIILLLFLLIVVPYLDISHRGINNATVEATLENQDRATLAQIFGGVAIAIGLYYTWRRIGIAEEDLKATQKNLEVIQEGQITERFTRAIDQLGAVDKDGNPAIEIRLGGIYALEKIATRSEEYYWPIIGILTAYVRKNSPVENKNVTNEKVDVPKILSLDIQAILTVIKKCKPYINIEKIDLNEGEANHLTREEGEARFFAEEDYLAEAFNYLDLHETLLWKANLYGAYLKGANLQRANLEEANLNDTNLQRAMLEGANLRAAFLTDANFEGAFLMGTNFEGAHLSYADLKYSFFTGAHLEGANFENADLEMTFFANAYLEGANLSEANLKRSIFIKANLNGAGLARVNLEGANLHEANLEGTYLGEANLYMADFEGANLIGAKELTIEQLSKVKTLYKAELDPELEIPLREKYPHLFDEPER